MNFNNENFKIKPNPSITLELSQVVSINKTMYVLEIISEKDENGLTNLTFRNLEEYGQETFTMTIGENKR